MPSPVQKVGFMAPALVFLTSLAHGVPQRLRTTQHHSFALRSLFRRAFYARNVPETVVPTEAGSRISADVRRQGCIQDLGLIATMKGRRRQVCSPAKKEGGIPSQDFDFGDLHSDDLFDEPVELDEDFDAEYDNVGLLTGPKPEGELPGKILEADLVDMGVTLHIGESIAGEGYGLYMSKMQDVMMTVIPQWYVLCGYALGNLLFDAKTDKAVSFSFREQDNNVLWNGKPTALREVFDEVSKNSSSVTLLGHSVSRDGHEWTVTPSDTPMVFVPSTSEGEEEEMSWQTLGQFANDLAFPADSDSQYTDRKQANILQLVYNLKLIEGDYLYSSCVLLLETLG
ncbi:hypothetical protein AAMO2058_001476400 [Amorphochlora amoebiformis]